jgi:Bacterial HORMA domain family 1
MSYSYTTTESFTLTHARRLATKVAADMHQCQRFYGYPTDTQIENYQQELIVLLHGGYMKSYEFGFKTTDGFLDILSVPACLNGTVTS